MLEVLFDQSGHIVGRHPGVPGVVGEYHQMGAAGTDVHTTGLERANLPLETALLHFLFQLIKNCLSTARSAGRLPIIPGIRTDKDHAFVGYGFRVHTSTGSGSHTFKMSYNVVRWAGI